MNKDILHSIESPINLFLHGEQRKREDHAEYEKKRLGILRIGNAGCLLPDNTTIGADPRTTLARFIGHQLPVTAAQSYFDGGILNEAIWEGNVQASGTPYRCEEDFPVSYPLTDSVKISGRPDMVIGEDVAGEFVPTYGIELKSVQAINSAANKLLMLKPDSKHLIQAGAYAMFLDIPFTLVYTSNVSGGITKPYVKRMSKSTTVSEGKVEFPVGWEKGRLYYVNEDGCKQFTIVTQQGILDYYSLIAEMAQTKTLVRVLQTRKDILGERMKYDPNDYCDLDLLVDPNHKFEDWAKRVEIACDQPYLIKYAKTHYEIAHTHWVRQGPSYKKQADIIDQFETLEEARTYIFGGKI